MAEVLAYAPDLNSMTGGRGDYSMSLLATRRFRPTSPRASSRRPARNRSWRRPSRGRRRYVGCETISIRTRCQPCEADDLGGVLGEVEHAAPERAAVVHPHRDGLPGDGARHAQDRVEREPRAGRVSLFGSKISPLGGRVAGESRAVPGGLAVEDPAGGRPSGARAAATPRRGGRRRACSSRDPRAHPRGDLGQHVLPRGDRARRSAARRPRWPRPGVLRVDLPLESVLGGRQHGGSHRRSGGSAPPRSCRSGRARRPGRRGRRTRPRPGRRSRRWACPPCSCRPPQRRVPSARP